MSAICSPLLGCPEKLLTWAALTCSLQISNFAAQTCRRHSATDKKKSGGNALAFHAESLGMGWGWRGAHGCVGRQIRSCITTAAPPHPGSPPPPYPDPLVWVGTPAAWAWPRGRGRPGSSRALQRGALSGAPAGRRAFPAARPYLIRVVYHSGALKGRLQPCAH